MPCSSVSLIGSVAAGARPSAVNKPTPSGETAGCGDRSLDVGYAWPSQFCRDTRVPLVHHPAPTQDDSDIPLSPQSPDGAQGTGIDE
jgi:hypothetical protein